MNPPQSLSWDVFCTVIDNYGDIGVSWRLARQLAIEHQQKVRLWVNDLNAFRHIQPKIDAGADVQHLEGVEIRCWPHVFPDVVPAQVVVEALACNLPDTYIARMATCAKQPVWINLEYLSAESWVEGVHGLPSPHPPLDKYFFMPGFNRRTGGLIREARLLEQRNHFQSSPSEQAEFWASIGMSPVGPETRRISLFNYENQALPSLLSACANGPHALSIVVPLGKSTDSIATWFGKNILNVGDRLEQGKLQVTIIPMLEQDRYDQLLWACDINFVRGEDSFVRAQFASKPFVWQVYLQDEGAHFLKLDAFLDMYCAQMPLKQASTTRCFSHAWNLQHDVGALWLDLLEEIPSLNSQAAKWSYHLASQNDLASNLLFFCIKKLELQA